MASYIPNVTDVFPEPSLFTPNFSFLDSMLRRRQGMYEQGFAQVKNAYSNVSRNVTNGSNAVVRDQFLQQAQQNLKNLSSLDLSQQQNALSASNVFKPFYKNTDVLGDMALTSHWDQQESIADSYRLKDGGKEYSEDNINFVRKQRSAFASDAASSWKGYYSQKRSFNPYYNWNEEVMKAMDKFKPSTYKIDKLNGLYKITEESEGAKAEDVRRYLDGVLSDKAKQQMKIEADVRLNNDPQQLAQNYSQIAKNEIEMFDMSLKNIDKGLKQTKNKEEIEQLTKAKERILAQRSDIDNNLSKINSGDYSFIKNNGSELAYSIYYNQNVNKLAKGFSYDKITKTIGQDEVAVALMKEARADSRQAAGFRHAEKMKMIDLQISGQGQPASFEINQLSMGKGAAAFKQDFLSTQKQVDEYDKAAVTVTMQQKQYVLSKAKERNPNLNINDITQSFVNNWLKSGGVNGGAVSRNDKYFEYTNQLATIDALKAVPLNKLKQVNDNVMSQFSAEERKQIQDANTKIDKIGTIVLDDGKTITARELVNGINAGTIKKSGGADSYTFTINGKDYKAEDRVQAQSAATIQKNLNLLGAITQIEYFQGKGGGWFTNSPYEKYMKAINKNFDSISKDQVLSTKVIMFQDGSKQAKELENSVSSLFESGVTVKHRGVGVTGVNQGDSYFYITPGKDSKLNEEQIKSMLTSAGYTNEVVDQGAGNPKVYKISNLRSKVAQQFKTFSPLESAVINSVNTHQGNSTYTSAPFTAPGSSTMYTIRKDNGLYYLNIPGQQDSYPGAFSDPSEAVMTARVLSANNNAGLNQYLSY